MDHFIYKIITRSWYVLGTKLGKYDVLTNWIGRDDLYQKIMGTKFKMNWIGLGDNSVYKVLTVKI